MGKGEGGGEDDVVTLAKVETCRLRGTMTPAEFETNYPLILSWIQGTLTRHTPQARPVSSLGFKRLAQYFSSEVLASSKVVYVAAVPTPPLSAMGLHQFSDFENMNGMGITYLDTFFSREEARGNESLHFHELVHIIQWQVLGPRGFIAAYADGLERVGYRRSPLEVIAHTLESVFRNGTSAFDVAAVVREQLTALYHI
jgi:hypothetical protein